MRSPDELTLAFRARGLKVTPQRQLIFRILDGATHHPTAEAVYARASREMPTISLRTVYQTLNDLVGLGELQALDLGTGSARFDPNTTAHHHLVCDRCGAVRDVYLATDGLRPADDEAHGFTITTTEVVFRGRCDACVAADAPSRPATLTRGAIHA